MNLFCILLESCYSNSAMRISSSPFMYRISILTDTVFVVKTAPECFVNNLQLSAGYVAALNF